MKDNEKLDILIEKVSAVESDVAELKHQFAETKVEIRSELAETKEEIEQRLIELKAMEKMILDEVERVHTILDRHKEDKTVHTA